jgi:hypothetical protein
LRLADSSCQLLEAWSLVNVLQLQPQPLHLACWVLVYVLLIML